MTFNDKNVRLFEVDDDNDDFKTIIRTLNLKKPK
jgi:hypothetical protein